MKLRDRMMKSDPVVHNLISRLDPLIDGENLVRGAAVFTLLGDIAVKYSAHRILTTGTVHGLADGTNALITSSTPTTKAAALTMVNDIRAKFAAHVILTTGSVHGAVDTQSVPSLPKLNLDAGWDEIRDLANHLRARYEAHRVRAVVHTNPDATNTMAVATDGTQYVPTLDKEI